MLFTSFRIAVKALGRHKLRTALTMLGMMIGVAAVITMVALGTGAQQTVSEDVQSAGTNLVKVTAGNYTRGGMELGIQQGLGASTTLTAEDAAAIGEIPGVRYFAPEVKLRGWVANAEAPDTRTYTQILGTVSTHPRIYGWDMARGRFFSDDDVEEGAAVAVIGMVTRDRVFGDGVNPVGKDIIIRDQRFRVVGVSDTTDEDQIEWAFVPYTALQRVLGMNNLHAITVAAARAGEATRIAEEIKPLLRQRHNLDADETIQKLRKGGLLGFQGAQVGAGVVPDDFVVRTQAAEALTKGLYTSVAAFVLANMPKVDQANLDEMAGTLSRAGSTMTALLAAIATIALVVGGIGIMNIMLVSVTERTREIGIRRSVGARKRDVLLQFLVEAVTLGLMGGAIGIVLGFIASAIVTQFLEWPTRVSPQAVALAFGIAGAVAVFFGFYPARRASQLDPINALRYE
jgi:ABC-type antimicrobial peptide transport system permease subunit